MIRHRIKNKTYCASLDSGRVRVSSNVVIFCAPNTESPFMKSCMILNRDLPIQHSVGCGSVGVDDMVQSFVVQKHFGATT